MDFRFENILVEQCAARDHIAIHGLTKISALWLEDWVKEEVLLRTIQYRTVT